MIASTASVVMNVVLVILFLPRSIVVPPEVAAAATATI
jgi:hypothetical protein